MNFSWRKENLRDSPGILVGADLSQEWLLPWWWSRYEKENQYPVAFIDFGMSFEKKNWCQERGELIPLRIWDGFIKTKDEMAPDLALSLEEEFGKQFWESRSVWFKKPMGLLQTPFRKTVWIDLDCEVRGKLDPLFDFANPFSMTIDPCDTYQNYNYPIYNTGVVSYQHGLAVFTEWAKVCFENNGQFRGDQEVLSHLMNEKNIQLHLMPPEYNWSRTQKENSEAKIVHWHGVYGKYVIRNQINVEELSFW